MLGFNGGLMGKRRVPASSASSGLWFPSEQSVAKRDVIWPPSPSDIFRYYRFANFANTSLNNNTIDFGEIELYDGDIKHTGITCTTSFSLSSGSASNIVDGISGTGSTSEATRAFFSSWSSVQATATISFDLGSTKRVTHVRIYSLFAQPRFPASFALQGSTDGTVYSTLATVTVGAFTLVSGSIYGSAKVSVF
jgi:hypothetical protein